MYFSTEDMIQTIPNFYVSLLKPFSHQYLLHINSKEAVVLLLLVTFPMNYFTTPTASHVLWLTTHLAMLALPCL